MEPSLQQPLRKHLFSRRRPWCIPESGRGNSQQPGLRFVEFPPRGIIWINPVKDSGGLRVCYQMLYGPHGILQADEVYMQIPACGEVSPTEVQNRVPVCAQQASQAKHDRLAGGIR